MTSNPGGSVIRKMPKLTKREYIEELFKKNWSSRRKKRTLDWISVHRQRRMIQEAYVEIQNACVGLQKTWNLYKKKKSWWENMFSLYSNRSLTWLWRMRVYLSPQKKEKKIWWSGLYNRQCKNETHPTKRNQTPFLRKLQNQLFLKHRTCITRRRLFRNQQRRHRILVSFIFP